MSSALGRLRNEHARILTAVEVSLQLANRLENGAAVPPDDLEAVMQFFSFVAHRSHRDKEEECLFPALRDKGFYEGPGCIGVLLAQHEESGTAFQQMIDTLEAYRGGNDRAAHEWAHAARVYCEGMRQHIRREEEVLFMNAERLLTDADQATLTREFTRIDERLEWAGIGEINQEFERVARVVGSW